MQPYKTPGKYQTCTVHTLLIPNSMPKTIVIYIKVVIAGTPIWVCTTNIRSTSRIHPNSKRSPKTDNKTIIMRFHVLLTILLLFSISLYYHVLRCIGMLFLNVKWTVFAHVRSCLLNHVLLCFIIHHILLQ